VKDIHLVFSEVIELVEWFVSVGEHFYRTMSVNTRLY
jgi:hypothetical protein